MSFIQHSHIRQGIVGSMDVFMLGTGHHPHDGRVDVLEGDCGDSAGLVSVEGPAPLEQAQFQTEPTQSPIPSVTMQVDYLQLTPTPASSP